MQSQLLKDPLTESHSSSFVEAAFACFSASAIHSAMTEAVRKQAVMPTRQSVSSSAMSLL